MLILTNEKLHEWSSSV